MNETRFSTALRARFVVVLTLAALMFVGVQLVVAADPIDSADLPPYRVDLVTYTLPAAGSDVSSWVYAVTAMTDTGGTPVGMDAVTVGVDLSCYFKQDPRPGTVITTPVTTAACTDGTYNCTAGVYTFTVGTDPVLGLSGVTWSALNPPQLETGPVSTTQIFAFRLRSATTELGNTVVGIHTTDGPQAGAVLGPVCPANAVQLDSVEATSGGLGFSALGLLLAGGAALGLVFVRRRSH